MVMMVSDDVMGVVDVFDVVLDVKYSIEEKHEEEIKLK